jgi:protein-disulfide isomerase
VTAVSRRSLLLGAAAVAALPLVTRSQMAMAAEGGAIAWDKATVPAIYPERVLGDANAPVAIIEYSSLTCPHCAHFHTDTLPQLKKDFIDSGKARLVVRDFPLDQLALAAALIARSAPKDMFFPYIEALFAHQEMWARAENPAEALTQLAVLAGMPPETVETALKNKDLLQAIVDVRSAGHDAYGIDSTPSFVVDGVKHSGALSYEVFADLINKAAKG